MTHSKEAQREALENVRFRMKNAEEYKSVWSDEFVAIEFLLSSVAHKDELLKQWHDWFVESNRTIDVNELLEVTQEVLYGKGV